MKMMKFFLLAAAAVAAISCTKEPVYENDTENTPETENPAPEVELVPMTFTASYADESENEVNSVQSKVAYENGATVWKVGDLIMVISSNGTATEFKAVEVDGSHATFEGLTEKAETYYAVSPASAYVDNDIVNGKIYANIPQNQTAVAGTFDREAFLSVATNSGSELYFKNSCSVIGFKLSDAADVKSVRFTANGQTNLAGTGYVGITGDPTHRWDGSYAQKSSYDMITLNAPDGGFVADTDYFLTIRQNNCPNGITVYIEYDDIVKSRTSENRLFPEGVGAMNKVRRLGQLDKDLVDLTPYETYQMGFDITIGDIVINNETNKNAVLISLETPASAPLKNGCYFVNDDVECSIGTYISQLIVIGNNPNKRSKLSRTATSFLDATSGEDYLYLKNISDSDVVDANNFQLNKTIMFEKIVFDNCYFNVSGSKALLSYTNDNRLMNDFEMVDCDCQLTGSGTILSTRNTPISNVEFKNNVIFGTTSSIMCLIDFTGSNRTDITNTTVENNTFYQVVAPSGTQGYIRAKSIENLTVKYNMFYDCVNTTNHSFVYYNSVSVSNPIASNNIDSEPENSEYRVYIVNGSAPSGVVAPSLTKYDFPLNDWDPANGKYNIDGTYGGVVYGAVR